MDKYLYWLDACFRLGNTAKRTLLDTYGDAKAVYYENRRMLATMLGAEKEEIIYQAKRSWDLEREYEKLMKQGIETVVYGESGYPQRLLYIPDAPFCLYYKGELPAEDKLNVAVIGARDCSEYGLHVARELGKELGKRGINLISGMARGIDGISQTAAIEAGGKSYGVFGCGVDICYPRNHRGLYESLQRAGGIMSTYLPGTQPRPELFPPRNRIVSGLAEAVVVIEARQKSGTLITVEMALEQGRDVYAVPGRITDRLSDGCNRLLTEGAGVFTSPKDFVDMLADKYPDRGIRGSGKLDKEGSVALTDAEKQLFQSLDYMPKALEELALMAKISTIDATGPMMMLCIKGLAIEKAPGWYAKV